MKITQLNNEKGSIFVIAAAIVVSLVTLASSASLINIAKTDHQFVEFQHDKIQEELLLRSELTRTSLAIDHNENIPLPDRRVKIITPKRRRIYEIDNNKTLIRTDYAIQSLIRSYSIGKSGREIETPIKRMTERYLKKKSLAEYQYFTMNESSENEDGGDEAARVKFWGPDVLYGPVHSNSDIWLQQAGGGSNNDWPTFYAMVTTTGRFRKYPGGGFFTDGELEQICYGGWQEEVPEVGFSPDAKDIQQNGIELGSETTDIVFVKLEGNGFTSLYGEIQDVETKEFDVYSWYPSSPSLVNDVIAIGGNWFEDSDLIWTNEITIRDTIWSTGLTGSLNNNSYWVPNGQLWISGHLTGSTTFGCADTVFVIGDITYDDTVVGDNPDGFSGVQNGVPQYNDPVNTTDYFGLVSEQKILIRYKHKDPITNEIIDDNCDDIYMYGAYAAIGMGDPELYGDMNCHYEGIFTFQYHHPHGSIPDFVAPTPYLSRDYVIELHDNAGNSWNGASVNVYVDGNLVLEDIDCYGEQSNFSFEVGNGDVIETVYTQGTNNEENSYVVIDHEDNIVMQDGPNPTTGLVSPMQLITPTAEDDTLYSYVDLHKYVFPKQSMLPPQQMGFNMHGAVGFNFPVCGFPEESNLGLDPNGYNNSYPNSGPNYVFPYGTDYPWYNPIWPESQQTIVYERGIIHLYGAVAQTRRGFVHRSGSDPYNHPQGSQSPSPWEMDEYHFDGNHPSTGYDKDYYYDQRFLTTQPPDFPQVHENWGQYQLAGFVQRSWYFKSPDDWGL